VSQLLTIGGGILWLGVLLTLIGYGLVHGVARNYRPAVLCLVIALMIAWMGAFAIGNSQLWAAQVWK
jgi:hypothetical protein